MPLWKSSEAGSTSSARQPENPNPSSVLPIPTAPPFSSFKFNTIGKAPELLKRFADPNPDLPIHGGSSSPSSSPDLETERRPSSSEASNNLHSLSARLSMNESRNDIPLEPISTDSTFVPPVSSLAERLLGKPLSRATSEKPTRAETRLKSDIPGKSGLGSTEMPGIIYGIHARLSSSFSDLIHGRTPQVVHLAESAQTKSADLVSCANRAYANSQQALSFAEKYAADAIECVSIAESIETVLSQIQRTVQDRQRKEDDADKSVSDNLKKLEELGQQIELEETNRRVNLENTATLRNSEHQARSVSGVSISNNTVPATGELYSASNARLFSSIEHEADAAAQAWDQQREHVAKQRKLAEEKVRNRREAVEVLELEHEKILAQLDELNAKSAKARTERQEAEKNANEAELREKEMIAKISSSKHASEERSLPVPGRIQQAHEMRDDKVGGTLSDRNRIIAVEKDFVLQKRLQKEKDLALAQQQRLLEEQEVKRQEISAQKQRAAEEAGKKILAERAKINNNLAAESACPPQSIFPAQPLPQPNVSNADFGNIVSKKTLIAKGQKTLPDLASQGKVVSPSNADSFSVPQPLPSNVVSPETHYQAEISISDASTTTSAGGILTSQQKDEPAHQVANAHVSNTVFQLRDNNLLMQRRDPVVKPLLPQRLTSLVPSHQNRTARLPPSTPHIASFQTMGCPNQGNIRVIPRTHLPPISPEAQQSNLRSLMHANGISSPPAKRNIDKVSLKIETDPVRAPSLKPTSSKSLVEYGLLKKKLKVESPVEMPLLSLPDPFENNSSQVAAAETEVPIGEESKRGRDTTTPGNFSANFTSPDDIPAKPSPNTNDRPLSGSPTNLAKKALPVHPLPPRPVGLSPPRLPPAQPAEPAPPTVAAVPSLAHHFDDDSRMGPDAAITDGWSKLSPTFEDERQRLGRWPAGHDHYSPAPRPRPSANSFTTGPPSRSRPNRRKSSRLPLVIDHYSPPHGRPQPLPKSHFAGNASGGRSRDSASGPNSRVVSPERESFSPKAPRFNRRSLSPLSGVLPPLPFNAGNKRPRDDGYVYGPPTNRPRFDESRVRSNDDFYPPDYEPYNIPPPWSRPPVYEHPFTPEPPPFSSRFGDEVPPMHGYSPLGYRMNPIFDSDLRHPNSESGPGSYNRNSHYPTKQTIYTPAAADESRPSFLNRLTDSADMTVPNEEQKLAYKSRINGLKFRKNNRAPDSAETLSRNAEQGFSPSNIRSRPKFANGRGQDHQNKGSLITRIQPFSDNL